MPSYNKYICSFLFFCFFCLKALFTKLLQTVRFHPIQSYISEKCIAPVFFSREMSHETFQSLPKWPAGYKMNLAMFLINYMIMLKTIWQKEYNVFTLTFKSNTYTRNVVKIILNLGETQERNLSILLRFNIYSCRFICFKLYIIQHLYSHVYTQLNLWMYFLPL